MMPYYYPFNFSMFISLLFRDWYLFSEQLAAYRILEIISVMSL